MSGLAIFAAVELAALAHVTSNAWVGAWFDIEPSSLYVYSCDVGYCGKDGGVVSSTVGGVTMHRRVRGAGTVGVTNAFLSIAGRRKSRLALRRWSLDEEAECRAVRLTRARPRFRRVGGIDLGFGESVDGNTYRYGTRFSAESHTHSRPLVSWRGGECSTTMPFGDGAAVDFVHELSGRAFLSAEIGVALDAGDGVAVSVSCDGTNWIDVATFSGIGAHRAAIPASFFPAKRLYARVHKATSGQSAKLRQYSFDAKIDGPAAFGFGATDYLDAETGKELFSAKPWGYLDDTASGLLLDGAPNGVACWEQSSGRKVFRARPAPTARGRALKIVAARNEAEARQLVIRPDRALKGVRVTAEMPDGIDVEVRRVGYVLVDLPMDSMGARGLWPDPIFDQDAGGCDIAAGENQPFWVTAKPRRGVKAGTYRGRLKVTARGVAAFSVPVEVRVFGFDFPDRMTCETAFGLSYKTVFDYHHATGKADKAAVAAKYLEMFARHHITPYTPYYGVAAGSYTDKWMKTPDPADSEPTFAWDAWDEAMSNALCNLHFNTLKVPLKGMGSADPLSRVPRKTRRINGAVETNRLYEVYMERYLKSVEGHLREKGWIDKAYVYAFDEPERADYEYMKIDLDRIRRYAPSLRRMVTTAPREGLDGFVNLWCPITEHYDREKAHARQKAGDDVWWYITFSSKPPLVNEHVEHAGVDMRVWLWQTWLEKVQGVLIWETAHWNSKAAYPDPDRPQNPYEDTVSWTKSGPWNSGEGKYVYPPEECFKTKGPVVAGPVDSIRFEMLREGIEDYEYFAILRRADPSSRLLAVPRDVAASLRDYSRDPIGMETHRLRLGEAIERLAKHSQD